MHLKHLYRGEKKSFDCNCWNVSTFNQRSNSVWFGAEGWTAAVWQQCDYASGKHSLVTFSLRQIVLFFHHCTQSGCLSVQIVVFIDLLSSLFSTVILQLTSSDICVTLVLNLETFLSCQDHRHVHNLLSRSQPTQMFIRFGFICFSRLI